MSVSILQRYFDVQIFLHYLFQLDTVENYTICCSVLKSNEKHLLFVYR